MYILPLFIENCETFSFHLENYVVLFHVGWLDECTHVSLYASEKQKEEDIRVYSTSAYIRTAYKRKWKKLNLFKDIPI